MSKEVTYMTTEEINSERNKSLQIFLCRLN